MAYGGVAHGDSHLIRFVSCANEDDGGAVGLNPLTKRPAIGSPGIGDSSRQPLRKLKLDSQEFRRHGHNILNSCESSYGLTYAPVAQKQRVVRTSISNWAVGEVSPATLAGRRRTVALVLQAFHASDAAVFAPGSKDCRP